MKIYNTQEEINADIKDGVLKYNGDITIHFDCVIDANIDAHDIKAGNINARDINAGNIIAWNINARDINARDINAGNIIAGNINARDINAVDIDARDIKAGNISYFAFCISYYTLKCKSIEGRRDNSIHTCLDTLIEYLNDVAKEVTLTLTDEQLKKIKELLNDK